MRELWVPIAGFEGRYEVSDQGRIRSVDHRVRCKNGTRLVKGRVLRPAPHRRGHLMVMLGRGNNCDVHRAVAIAFHGSPGEKGMEVLHLNHNPADNRAENLRWGTRSENLKMDYAAGTRKTNKNFNRWGYRYD
jgi:hypothetical protein